MYINFEYLKKKDLTFEDVVKLQLIRQNRTEKLDDLIKETDFSETFKEKYILERTNGKFTLTLEGRTVLDELQMPYILDNDVVLAKYLLQRYKEEGKILCSKAKITQLISWFRVETNLTHEELSKLIQSYLNSPEGQYNRKLDYLFFKPDTPYQKYHLGNSRLYEYFESIKDKKTE